MSPFSVTPQKPENTRFLSFSSTSRCSGSSAPSYSACFIVLLKSPLLCGCWNLDTTKTPTVSAVAVYHPAHPPVSTHRSSSANYIVQLEARMVFGQHPTWWDTALWKQSWTKQQHKHISKIVLEIEKGLCHKTIKSSFPLSVTVGKGVWALPCTALTRCLLQNIQPALLQTKAAASKSIPLFVCISNADTKVTPPLVLLKESCYCI